MSLNSLILLISVAILLVFIFGYFFIKIIKLQSNNKNKSKRDVFSKKIEYNIDYIADKLNNNREKQIEYYKFLREEIKREDEITHQRLTWGITFQGFLISAVAAMLVFSWKDSTIGIFYMRKITILATGIVGLFISYFVYHGVLASRNSIRNVVEQWNAVNLKWLLYPYEVPQAFGQEDEFNSGTKYAERVPYFFAIMWFLFVSSYIFLTYFFEIQPCSDMYRSVNDILSCVYKMQPQEPSFNIYKL